MVSQLRVAALAALLVAASALQVQPAQKNVTAADVAGLRKQLETMAGGLEQMLNGNLAHAEVAPTMRLFVGELKQALNETQTMKDPAAAMKKLEHAHAGVNGLLKEMTERQTELMKQDDEQKVGLLMGVLMTKARENATVSQQLEVVKSDDFASLAVSKFLLANHSASLPLFKQAAAYLDTHGGKVEATMTDKEKKAFALKRAQATAAQLQGHLDTLIKQEKAREAHHEKKMKELSDKEKGLSKKDAHRVELQKHREERNFKKSSVMNKRDISGLTAAVAALKKGDMKALETARTALMNSLKAMQSQTGGFLHFIQLGHRVQKRDCPFCAAQCFDKCHQAGNSYVTCLTQCADAGK